VIVTVNPVAGAVTVYSSGTYCDSKTLTAGGGTNATIYWQGTSSNGTSTVTLSTSRSVTSSGTYYFRAYNANCGWGTPVSATVTINTSSTTPTGISGTTTLCSGGSTTLTQSGGALGTGGVWYWYSGSCGSAFISSGSASITVSPGSTTSYYVRAQGTCNTTTCANATVTVNSVPGAVTAYNGGTQCGGSRTLTAGGGTNGTIYWQGTTSNGTSTATPSTNQTVSSGTYYFRARNGCGWGTEGSAAVTINLVPSGVTASGGGTFCGSTSISASGGTGGTIYYQGTTSNGTSTALGGTPQTVSSSGTYYFRSRSSAGCWGTESSAAVTINVTPGAVSVSGAGTYCNSTILTATGGTNGTIYWQGTTSGGTSTVTSTNPQTVSSTGTYYFRSRSAAGCWGTEGSASVTINTSSTAPSGITGTTTICNGGATTLTQSGGALGTGGVWYWYSGSCGGTFISSGSASITVSPGSTTSYYVRAQGTCNTTTCASATVTVNSVPGGVTTYNGGTQCGGSRTLTAGGGTNGTIYWQGTSSNGTSTGTPSTNQTVSSSGTYYFRAYNGCGWGTEGSAAVTINSVPSGVTASGSGTFCGSTSISATGGTGGTIYYQGTTSNGTSTALGGTPQTVSSSGTHYFRSRSSAGCWGTEGSVAVTINVTPGAVSVSGAGTHCNSATLTATGGTNGTIYWQGTTGGGTSTVNSTNPQSVSSTGTYYFRSRSTAGCWGNEGSASVTINTSSTAPSSITGTTTICNGSSTSLTSNGGSLGTGGVWYWYSGSCGGTFISSGSTSITVSPGSTTSYYVRAQGTCNTTACASATVTVNNVPGGVTAYNGGTQCGGSRTLTAGGGTNGTIYWQGTTSNGTSTATPSTNQTVSSSGTYYFRALNGCGWSAQGSATISIITLPANPSPTATPSLICGSGSSSLSATVSDAIIYWYTGSCGGALIGTGNSITVSPATTTTYYASAYNATTGCWSSTCGSVTVTFSIVPDIVTVNGGGTYCSSATLTASGGTGGVIYWQGTTSGGTSTANSTNPQTVSSSGTYYFRAYSVCGWGTQSSTTVTINPAPSAVTASGGGAFCGSTSISASGGTGGTIYYQGTTSNGTSTASGGTPQTVSSSGTYYFRSRSAAGCWGAESSVTVTINTVPSPVTVPGSGTYCGSTSLSASGGTGGTIYFQGTTSNGTSTALGGTPQSISSSGTYYFRSRSAAGCWGTEGSAAVTITTIPGGVTVNGDGTYCDSKMLTATGGTNGTIYWQGTTNGGTSTASPATAQTVTTSGTYYFRAHNQGCWGTQDMATITINTSSTAPTGITGTTTICNGGSTTLTLSGGSLGTGGVWYWYSGSCGSTPVANGVTSISVSPATTTNYYVRAEGTCNTTTCANTTVTVNNIPGTVSVSGGTTQCGGTVVLTASGGTNGTIYWQGTTSGGTSTANSTNPQTVSSSGTYYFRAKNACGWSTEGSAAVTINSVPSAVTVSGGGTYCGSTSVSASGGTGGTIYYQGSTSNGTSTALGGTPQTVSTSGTYYFRSRSAAGCWGAEGSVTVTINVVPGAVSVSGAGTYCNSTILTATGGTNGTIYWQGTTSGGTSTVTSTNPQTVSSTGTYYFRSRSAAGCWGNEGSASVTINTSSTAPSGITGTTTICNGGSTTLTLSGGSLGTGGVWYWYSGSCGSTPVANGVTSISVSPATTTNYYVRAEGTCNTTTCANTTVTVNNIPGTVSVSGGTTQCGGTVVLTANGGTNGTIYWQGTTSGGTSTANSTNPQTVSSSGTYYFRAKNACGWSTEGSAAVTITTVPGAVTAYGAGTYCDSKTLTATGGTNGTIYWQGTTNGGTSTASPATTQTVTASGTYYFRAYNQGCWGTQNMATVTINTSSAAPTGITGTTTICNGGSTTLTLSGGSLGTGGVWYWYSGSCGGTFVANGVTSINVSPATTSNYYVRAQGTCNTTTCASETVTVNNIPGVVTVYNGGSQCGGSRTLTAGGGTNGTIYWQGTSNNGTSTGTPSTNQTVSSSGTNYFRAYNGCGWGNQGSATVSIISVPSAAIWMGTSGSDWDNPSNWLCGAVPTASDDVIISYVTNHPVVNSINVATCRNITIDALASLYVNSGKDLSVYGNWTNNGQSNVGNGTVIFAGSTAQTINGSTTFGNLTINNANGVTLNNPTEVSGVLTPTSGTLASGGNLTLVSTASQTALIAGTGSGNVSGNVTMQRYMASRLGYHYYSSPFNGASINEFADEIGTIITGNPYIGSDTTQTVNPFPNFFAYDETMGPTMSIGWTGAGSTLQTMRGYCINFGASAAPLTTDITGVVNNGNLSISLTKTITGNTFADGWNLIGNPYPSPVDWQSGGWTKTNMNNAIYYFDAADQYTGTYSYFVNGYGTPSGTTGIIASMQGFFVKATGTGSLDATNAVRVSDPNPVFYKATVNNPTLRLRGYPVNNTSAADETVIYFDPQATSMFDGNFDAYKMMNNNSAYPNIFTRDSTPASLSIQALPPLSNNTDVIIPLGYITKTNGNFTINASEILNFDPSLHIYLEDNQTSTSQDLTANPVYTFSMNANAPQYRFFIRFSPSILTGIDENGSSFVDAWASGKDIYVNYSNSSRQPAEISVYNMLGQKIFTGTQEGHGTKRYTVDKPGCYIINVVSNNSSYQKKIIVL